MFRHARHFACVQDCKTACSTKVQCVQCAACGCAQAYLGLGLANATVRLRAGDGAQHAQRLSDMSTAELPPTPTRYPRA